MENNCWEIHSSELFGTWELTDWILNTSKLEIMVIPKHEQELIDWCIEHFGEVGYNWTYCIGIAYMQHVPIELIKNENVSIIDYDGEIDKIKPDDVIFIFYNEEDAIEFKLVWS